MTTYDDAARDSGRTGGVDLEVETILPSQFFGGPRMGADLQPEKRLMLAVLEEAVSTYQNNAAATTPAGRRLFADADAWFAAGERTWLFSFVNICSTLGLEASALRRGLAAWRDRQRQRVLEGEPAARVMFRRMNGPRHSTTGRASTPLRDVA